MTTNKEIKKLSKKELHELMLLQSKKIDELEEKIEKLNDLLNNEDILLSNYDSIAEGATSLPATEELEKTLYKEKYKSNYKSMLRSTICVLLVVFAISAIAANFVFSVLKISGTSMQPNLAENDIVISVKTTEYRRGDIIAFYYNNKILIKRVIATAGEWVEIDINGNIYVNKELIDEPYIKQKAAGESDLIYPFQVPEDSYFVLGDLRENSLDSRNSVIGCVPKDNVVGNIFFRVWPLNDIKNNFMLGGD